MQTNRPTFNVKFLLFILFFLGIALSAWIILDAELFQIFITRPEKPSTVQESNHITSTGANTAKPSSTVDRLRQSIVLVTQRDCDDQNKTSNGTGFIVKSDGNARYIATNAHVIRAGVRCGSIMILDHKGIEHKTKMVGIALNNDFQNDLAVLKLENITDGDLPPLEFLNSTEYQSGHDGEKVVTIGYPVLGTASTPDKASISSEGQISQYDTSKNYFIASGLSLNPGNSGGPVFLAKNFKVLGVAVAKTRVQVAENVGMFIPIDRFKNFFRDKTGKEL